MSSAAIIRRRGQVESASHHQHTSGSSKDRPSVSEVWSTLDVFKTYFSPQTRIGAPAAFISKNAPPPETVPSEQHVVKLVALFSAWKALLLVVAYASPGPGYDTSTSLLFDRYQTHSVSFLGTHLERLLLRLTRWDAIYFASSSERGHLYEQEWAFSWFHARITSALSHGACAIAPIVVPG
jgi:phosphatidylinositol glycan class V